MRRLSFLLACLPALAQAATPSDNGQLAGVWQGKLGNTEITACFNFPSKFDNRGNYYYARHKTPIGLLQTRGQAPWVEVTDGDDKTGSWQLAPAKDGQLSGTWQHPKNGKTLPIRLQLVRPPAGDEEPCASSAYNAALEDFPKLVTSRAMLFKDSKQYTFRSLRLADQVTVELLTPTAPALASINQQLRALLPKNKADLAEYFEQRRNFLRMDGRVMEDEVHAEPTFWSTRHVTVSFYRWAAGMGRNGISNQFRTWDLRTGKEVDVWQWFGTKSQAGSYDVSALPPKLRAKLFKDVEIGDECKADYQGRGYYHLSLTETGMRFWEEAYGSGCEQDFKLSYAELAPFLTAQGKQALGGASARR